MMLTRFIKTQLFIFLALTVVALLALALFAPNSQQIIGWAEAKWKGRAKAGEWAPLRLAPLAFAGFATTLLLFLVSISGMRHGLSPFIYTPTRSKSG